MLTVYLGLGSNLGDRAANLRAAIDRLRAAPLRIDAVSSIYETAPVGETPEPVPAYLNCALRARTLLQPEALLDLTQQVEAAGGRTPTFRWGPRTIDVDLLLYDSLVMRSSRLVLPHPRLRERAFVLRPLAELTPHLALPDGTPVADLLRLPSVAAQEVTAWTDAG